MLREEGGGGVEEGSRVRVAVLTAVAGVAGVTLLPAVRRLK